jgi:hypothetical protein
MKNMEETTYILGIKIYKDRSRRLLGLSQSTYIDKILKLFSMEESNRKYLSILQGIHLSKDVCPKTKIKIDKMERISYASVIGSIMYVTLCIKSYVSYALSIMSIYQFIPGKSY